LGANLLFGSSFLILISLLIPTLEEDEILIRSKMKRGTH